MRMVLMKHNSLKSDIFFNPIFIPDVSGSGVWVQVLEVAVPEIWFATDRRTDGRKMEKVAYRGGSPTQKSLNCYYRFKHINYSI